MAKAKTAKKAKPQALDLEDVLNQATAKGGTGRKKDSKLILPTSTETVKLADACKDDKREIDSLTTQYEKNGNELRVLCAELRLEEISKGNFQKSIYIECSNGELIRVTQSDKWSVVNPENIPELKQTCADLGVEFEDYFEVVTQIVTLKGVLDDEQKIIDLILALGDGDADKGKAKFLLMFEYKKTVRPIENYDEKQFDLKTDVREELNSFTKQAKASLVTK